MVCPKCMVEINADSLFCRFCGTAVADPPDSPASAQGAEKKITPSSGAAREPSTDPYRDPSMEQEVWGDRPSWRSDYGLFAAWALVGAVLLGWALKNYEAGSPAVSLALLAVLGGGVVLVVREFLLVMSLRYRLTTQRLFIHRGLITREIDQMELMRVDDVRVRQGVVDRLVNTGDIEIISTDATDKTVTLRSVSDPASVAEALRRHVRGTRSKGTLQVEHI